MAERGQFFMIRPLNVLIDHLTIIISDSFSLVSKWHPISVSLLAGKLVNGPVAFCFPLDNVQTVRNPMEIKTNLQFN